MNDFSTYKTARATIADIEAIYKRASDEWQAIPGLGQGPMGLTPDSVKQSPEYRAAQSVYNYWHRRLRAANAEFLRRYKKEYQAERRAARAALTNA